jgi:hypothetical protein
MVVLSELNESFADGREVRLIEEGIYTVLDDVEQVHHYDRRAAAYDRIVGTWIYNAVMWGASPADYTDFARKALESSTEGKILDAGCGSMLFTASAYLDTERTIIAFDQFGNVAKRSAALNTSCRRNAQSHLSYPGGSR